MKSVETVSPRSAVQQRAENDLVPTGLRPAVIVNEMLAKNVAFVSDGSIPGKTFQEDSIPVRLSRMGCSWEPTAATGSQGAQPSAPLPASTCCSSADSNSGDRDGDAFSEAMSAFISKISAAFDKLLSQLTTVVDALAKKVEELKAAVIPPAPAASTPSASTPAKPMTFAEKVRGILKPDSSGLVNEADLRRGVVEFQLYQKEPALGDRFAQLYSSARSEGAAADAAVRKALIAMVSENRITRDEASWVFSLSFRSANFSGKSELASSGGIAADAAIRFAESTLAGIQSGAVAVPSLTL